MLVSASNWTTADHMMLVRCIRDSLDVAVLGYVLDHLDMPTLHLPMGTC